MNLLGRNVDEAPTTTAAPYAISSMLTQSQKTWKDEQNMCQAFDIYENLSLYSILQEANKAYKCYNIKWLVCLLFLALSWHWRIECHNLGRHRRQVYPIEMLERH
jgi:hypothetical protein